MANEEIVQIQETTIGRCEVIRLAAYIGPADSLSAVTAVLLNEELTGTLVRRGHDYFLELVLPRRAISGQLLPRAVALLAEEARTARRLSARPLTAAVAS